MDLIQHEIETVYMFCLYDGKRCGFMLPAHDSCGQLHYKQNCYICNLKRLESMPEEYIDMSLEGNDRFECYLLCKGRTCEFYLCFEINCNEWLLLQYKNEISVLLIWSLFID